MIPDYSQIFKQTHFDLIPTPLVVIVLFAALSAVPKTSFPIHPMPFVAFSFLDRADKDERKKKSSIQ